MKKNVFLIKKYITDFKLLSMPQQNQAKAKEHYTNWNKDSNDQCCCNRLRKLKVVLGMIQ